MSKQPDLDSISAVMIKGRDYSYAFSRGLLAHSLKLKGLPLDQAYDVAKKVQKVLIQEGIIEIDEQSLREYVRTQALDVAGEELAFQYNIIETWRGSSIPLIILLAGAKGTGTSIIAEGLAKKLAIPQLFSTSIVAQILRKMIAVELAPELHSKSYKAHENLRPLYSVLYDKVLVGYEEHSRFPAEGVEVIVRRAVNEGLSIIIRGEHLVPRFLTEELINHPNVLYICLELSAKEVHRERYISDYEGERKEEKVKNFNEIRKIHDYLVEEAKNRKHLVFESSNTSATVDSIYEIVLNRLASIFGDESKEPTIEPLDRSRIHS